MLNESYFMAESLPNISSLSQYISPFQTKTKKNNVETHISYHVGTEYWDIDQYARYWLIFKTFNRTMI